MRSLDLKPSHSIASVVCALLVVLTLCVSLTAQPNPTEMSPTVPDGAGVPTGSDALGAIAHERRAEFVAAVRNRLVRVDARIAEVAKASEAETPSTDTVKNLNEAREARLLVEHQLGKVDQASADQWSTLRDGVLEALRLAEAACAQAAGNRS